MSRHSFGARCVLAAALLTLVSFAAAAMARAAAPDCDIFWNEVLHDSFDIDYRGSTGAQAAGAAPTLELRLRVAQSDLTSARVRVWDDVADTESWIPMAWDGAFDDDPVTYDWWVVDLPLPSTPTILYYLFELTDDGTGGSCPPGFPDVDYYLDDDPQFLGGGFGGMSDTLDDSKSYQVTVFDAAFDVPEWLQRATIYQVFPDRFRNGEPANDPVGGTGFVYGAPYYTPDLWNTPVCDPRDELGPCLDTWSSNFYGGDLRGLVDKVEEGYFDDLGVTALYLNPIFRAPSNHRYDTSNYLEIDPILGTEQEFLALAAATANRGMRLILDGVFNHTASDGLYFDFYSRWDENGVLTSPGGPGADDDSGACEAGSSPYYGWFWFPDIGNPGGGGVDLCFNGPADEPQTYEAWFGFGSLPKLRSGEPAVRDLLYAGGDGAVGPHWVLSGADGWRLDVGADVDCGATCDPSNDFWEEFRAAVRGVSPEAVILGEEWGDASAWLLGDEWDAVMNYRFRSAAMGWLAENAFEDNDSRPGRVSGPIEPLTPSLFHARLLSIWEDYPPQALRGMMNLTGSHDTNRLRFLLRKSNGDDDPRALQRLRQWYLLAFTYPGAPTIYYGDEVALVQDGVFANGTWEDDPYNRAPYPWPDTPGAFVADDSMRDHVVALAAIRSGHRVLQDGDVHHGLVVDDARDLYGFGRTRDGEAALVVLNNSFSAHAVELTGLDQPPYSLADGAVVIDELNGGFQVVEGGSLTLEVPGEWGAIGVLKAPLALEVVGACPGAVTLSIADASPGAPVGLLASLQTGATVVPNGPCAGTELGLIAPRVLGKVDVNSDGAGSLQLTVPGGACGASFQALDLKTCEVSPLAAIAP